MKKAKADPNKTITLKPDPRNARRHTPRNQALIRASLTEVGPFRSIGVDGDDIIRAGNGVYAEAQQMGLTVRVVEAGPNELIAVKRADLKGRAAERAALFDNRTADLSIFDQGVLADMAGEDATLLDDLFTPAEQREISASADALETLDSDAKYYGTLGAEKYVKIVVAVGDVASVEEALRLTGEMNRGDALLAICQAYIRRGQTR